MIYLLSDLHGGENAAAISEYLFRYTEGDLLIVLGDVGLFFEDTEENRRFSESLEGVTDTFVYISKIYKRKTQNRVSNKIRQGIDKSI